MPERLRHEFVEYIPEKLENGVLYLALRFGTVVHNCCCGCGTEVVTPLSPTDWKLVYDGDSISLDPSIGNWGFPCRSHYWIKNGNVLWAKPWSAAEVAAGRVRDRVAKQQQYETKQSGVPAQKSLSFWTRVKRWRR